MSSRRLHQSPVNNYHHLSSVSAFVRWCSTVGLMACYDGDNNKYYFIRVVLDGRAKAYVRFHTTEVADRIMIYRSEYTTISLGVSPGFLRERSLLHMNNFCHGVTNCALCYQEVDDCCMVCSVNRQTALDLQTKAHLLSLNAVCLVVPKDITWSINKQLAQITALILMSMPAIVEHMMC